MGAVDVVPDCCGPGLPLLSGFGTDSAAWQLDALPESMSLLLSVHTVLHIFPCLHLDTHVRMEWEKTRNREMPPTNV